MPTGDYWQEVRSLVAAHRFRPLLEAYVVGPNNHPGLRDFAKNLDTTDVSLNAMPLGTVFYHRMKPPAETLIYPIMTVLSDWVVRDLAAVLLNDRKQKSPDYARKLLAVSPNSPHAMGLLIEDAWDEAEKRLDEWQRVAGDHPTFLAALARRYEQMGRGDEAERALKQYIEKSPDRWAFEKLAAFYKDRGDEARWKATLDEFLEKVEDHGLDHAKIRVEIAEALMRKGRFDEARPYADAAAQTWAEWAMRTAQVCAEGQQDWEAAEGWARARAERYPQTSCYEWLGFCQRTGHGDLAAARDWTLRYLNDLGDQTGPAAAIPRACLLMMSGQPAEAIAPLQRLIATAASNPSLHQSALVALAAAAARAGDLKQLDAVAKQFLDRYEQPPQVLRHPGRDP
ncbi:MAG: tetratricopeptide repeat protein [Isosphaeraceae bacterium]|nr:tetratricopeptide repeat protein [Isosphaeraceae bacterium]